MKLNKYNIFQLAFIPYSLCNIIPNSSFAYAEKQTIQIVAKSQSINMLTNKITFHGEVTLKYKECNLTADTILISYSQNYYKLSVIEAYGNPVIIHYQPNNKNYIIVAQSSKMCFHASDNTISLIGNAYLEKSGNSIQGDNITFLVKNKHIQINSNLKKQINTILAINQPILTK